jgi:hypothetical protein
MVERKEKEIIAEEQKAILLQYLEKAGISREDEHAQRILTKINAFQITTFYNERVVKTDGSMQSVTLAAMNSGNLREGSWSRGLLDSDPDKTLFADMVALGFTLSIFDREPATTGSFNGIWRGDGLPRAK